MKFFRTSDYIRSQSVIVNIMTRRVADRKWIVDKAIREWFIYFALTKVRTGKEGVFEVRT